MADDVPSESKSGLSLKERNVVSARVSMRKKLERDKAAGFKRITIAFSPIAVQVIDGYMACSEFTSREAALNAILERIDDDMYMRQEFTAVSK